MAKKGGFPGMGGNMSGMLKQVQKMQKDMEKMQSELEEKEIETTSGGGAIKVKMSGKKQLLSITIDEDVIDKDDKEMLEDLILTAVNSALDQVDELTNSSMSSLTGGLNIPGLF